MEANKNHFDLLTIKILIGAIIATPLLFLFMILLQLRILFVTGSQNTMPELANYVIESQTHNRQALDRLQYQQGQILEHVETTRVCQSTESKVWIIASKAQIGCEGN